MNTIIIRKAEVEDTEAIQDVLKTTWLATYPNEQYGVTRDDILSYYQDKDTPEAFQKRKEQIAHPSPDQQMLVATDGTRIIGICRSLRLPEHNQLKAIYVLPEYHGKGIGKMFWDEAMKFFDPSKDTIVQVAEYNAQAIAFYQKLGFVDTGKRFSDERFKMKSGSVIPEMEMILKLNV